MVWHRKARVKVLMALGRWLGVPTQIHQSFFTKGKTLNRS